MSVQPGYPAPGAMIGPYRIERTLGGGGMGVVFAALDVGLNRQVAIKVIAPHLADDPEFRTRFTREAQALAALDSAHVVHVYAYGEVDGRLYIATQLIPDGDLAARLQKYGAPSLPIALDLIAQVASGLADAHASGLIHRDIKPANVLLRHRNDSLQAFLSDFGIARMAGSETMTGSGVAGTPSYMAPELHTGDSAGIESDVYSLGCLLWAAVTGTAPYRGTSDFQIATAHFVEPVPQLIGDGAAITEINRILRKAMAKQPAERYGSAAAFRDDLLQVQSLAQSSAQGSESVASGRSAPRAGATGDQAPRRRRLAALVAALVVVVVVGSTAAAFALKDRTDDPGSDPERDPTSQSGSQTTSSPDPTTTPASPADGDRAKAVASLSQALQTTGGLTEAQANCTAEEWLEGDGLQAMIDDGFFDENMAYRDQDQSEMSPELKQAALAATIECAGAT